MNIRFTGGFACTCSVVALLTSTCFAPGAWSQSTSKTVDTTERTYGRDATEPTESLRVRNCDALSGIDKASCETRDASTSAPAGVVSGSKQSAELALQAQQRKDEDNAAIIAETRRNTRSATSQSQSSTASNSIVAAQNDAAASLRSNMTNSNIAANTSNLGSSANPQSATPATLSATPATLSATPATQSGTPAGMSAPASDQASIANAANANSVNARATISGGAATSNSGASRATGHR